jgi:hypothetical protein
MLWILVAAGVLCGFMVPKKKKSAYQFAMAGGIFITLVVLLALFFDYSSYSILRLLELNPAPNSDRWGLIQLTAIGYACLIAGIIAAIRYAFEKRQEKSESGF